MFNILRASFYKLFRDKTFIVTTFIGLFLSIFIPLLFNLIGMCTAGALLINSCSPSNSFGITVPINLAVFTINEFSNGTIRNKIIAGHSKAKIYLSLFITGLMFTFVLMVPFVGLSCLFGFLFNGEGITSGISFDFIWKFIVMAILSYIFITSFSILIATSIRGIGGTIPVLVISMVFLALMPLFAQGSDDTTRTIMSFINPVYYLGLYSNILSSIFSSLITIDIVEVIATAVSTLTLTAVCLIVGILEFNKRDVK